MGTSKEAQEEETQGRPAHGEHRAIAILMHYLWSQARTRKPEGKEFLEEKKEEIKEKKEGKEKKEKGRGKKKAQTMRKAREFSQPTQHGMEKQGCSSLRQKK